MTEQKKPSSVALYGLGGTGINIVAPFIKSNGIVDPGFAELTTYFVDTSRSNLRKANLSGPNVESLLYVIPGVDGSGKDRAENIGPIKERVQEILLKLKPKELNILVHSGSGGSGGVMGNVLAREIMDRGLDVIVLMVGSTDSKKELTNTLATLTTYERFVGALGRPIVVDYRQNDKDGSIGEVDKLLHQSIILLASFFSNQNDGMDSKDLKNWLNYPKVTSFDPAMVKLSFFSKDPMLGREDHLLALATLSDGVVPTTPPIPVEYQAIGHIPDVVKDAQFQIPTHAGLVHGFFHGVVSDLEEKIANFVETRKAMSLKPATATKNVNVDDVDI